jgi:hypothetical protein
VSDLNQKLAARHERIDKGLDLLERQSMQLGAKYERERIEQILDGWHVSLCKCDVCKAIREIKQEIKGAQK